MKSDIEELKKSPHVGAGLLLLEFLGGKELNTDIPFERGARVLFTIMLQEQRVVKLTSKPDSNDSPRFIQGFYQAFKYFKKNYLNTYQTNLPEY